MRNRLFLALLLPCLVACSGGADGPEDALPPEAVIDFPADGSSVGADQVTVRGRATDDSGVAAILVNGVPAATGDGFLTWEAVVALQSGTNVLRVETRDVAGNTDFEAALAAVERQDGFDFFRSARHPGGTLFELTFDPVADRLMSFAPNFLVGSPSRLFEIDVSTGERRALWVSSAGPGPAYSLQVGLAWDQLRAQLYYSALDSSSGREIRALDPQSGIVTVLYSNTIGSGPPIFSPHRITYDEGRDRVLILNPAHRRLYALNPVSLERIELSAESNSGPELVVGVSQLVDEIVVAPSEDRLFVVSQSSAAPFTWGRIIEVHPDLGDRTEILISGPPGGRSLQGAAWDSVSGRIVLLYLEDQDHYRAAALDPDLGLLETVAILPLAHDPPPIPVRAQLRGFGGRAFFADHEGFKELDLATGGATLISDCSELLPWYLDAGEGIQAGEFVLLSLDPQPVVPFPGPEIMGVIPGSATATFTWQAPSSSYELWPARLAADPVGNRLLFLNAGGLVGLELNSFQAGVIASLPPGIGGGIGPLEISGDFTVHAASRRTWISLSDAILEVDLDTAASAVISSMTVGSGPPIQGYWGMVADVASSRLLASDGLRILAVDLATGNRTVLSSTEVGEGPLGNLGDLTLDSARNVLLATDRQLDAILRIDLATGNRSVLVNRFGWARLSPVSATGILVAAGAFGGIDAGGAAVIDATTGEWCR